MDEIDFGQLREMEDRDAAIRAARQPIEQGIEGECDTCMESHPRLVVRDGQLACPKCRDTWKLG